MICCVVIANLALNRMTTLREQLEARERETLAPQAAKSVDSRGRLRDEREDDVRPAFQRDRDRIIHCKAFRRLKHKTQVFFAPTGDHYRTRLTHTLEVTQISRTVARALRLNEDLAEAIGLGHDLGHPPFGHLGEAALDACVRERYGGGFRHYEHSLRVVDRLERDGAGLNLTEPVRDGILRHSGGAPDPATAEGRIVHVMDRVAYINHDIDDAIRAGVLDAADLPPEPIASLGDTGSKRIDTLVHDLVEQPKTPCAARVQPPATQDQIKRSRQANQPRQPLGAATSRYQVVEGMASTTRTTSGRWLGSSGASAVTRSSAVRRAPATRVTAATNRSGAGAGPVRTP